MLPQNVFAFTYFVLNGLNETRQELPTLLPLQGGQPHDGRERIRVRKIPQMNYFDDHVCLWRM
jgi:hypothetical protein